METYDPDLAPEAAAWLALDEQLRITYALTAHRDRFPDALHNADANEIMHGSLHAIIETQIASASPEVTGLTIQRLIGEGLMRHAAIHAVMIILAEQLVALSQGDSRFDEVAWAKKLEQLSAADALGRALQSPRIAQGPETMNRAQRRASKKKKSDR